MMLCALKSISSEFLQIQHLENSSCISLQTHLISPVDSPVYLLAVLGIEKCCPVDIPYSANRSTTAGGDTPIGKMWCAGIWPDYVEWPTEAPASFCSHSDLGRWEVKRKDYTKDAVAWKFIRTSMAELLSQNKTPKVSWFQRSFTGVTVLKIWVGG